MASAYKILLCTGLFLATIHNCVTELTFDLSANIAAIEKDLGSLSAENIQSSSAGRLAKLRELRFDIDDLSDQISYYQSLLETGLANLKLRPFHLSKVMEIERKINNRYRLIKRFRRLTEEYDEFARWVNSDNLSSTDKLLEELHLKYFGVHNIRLSKNTPVMYRISEKFSEINSTSIVKQIFFYSEYVTLGLLELKSFLVNKFCWTVLRSVNRGDYLEDEATSLKAFRVRNRKRVAIIRDLIGDFNRVILTGDADTNVKGETYEELTRLIQGYVVNKRNLNADCSCRPECRSTKDATYISTCGEKGVTDVCSGKIITCDSDFGNSSQLGDYDYQLTMCLSDNVYRRYDFIKSDRSYGDPEQCTNTTQHPIFLAETKKTQFDSCSYCFCYCDEEGPDSDRYFNIREALSDVDNNMVVTGVRFIKHNRVFHLQIQEGKILSLAQIDEATLRWKPVDNYEIEFATEGEDFFKMDYSNSRMDLDEIQVNLPNYLVTGLKLTATDIGLHLEVRFTQYHFRSGTLLDPVSSSFWKTNDQISGYRQVNLHVPDISTKTPEKSEATLSTSKRHYVYFTHTDVYKDTAQTTVPFIDTQKVTSNSQMPLAGIGLYHKGTKGFGGFIAPLVITYDFSSLIK